MSASQRTTGPAAGAFVITPSDSTDFTTDIRQITIGTSAGVLVYIGSDGAVNTTGPLPVGTYPLLARRVNLTGTTATGLTGWL